MQCMTEAAKYRIYRIPKLRYSNRTEPNLIIEENKASPPIFSIFPLFIVFLCDHFLELVFYFIFLAYKKKFGKIFLEIFPKNVQKIRYFWILPNRSFSIR